MLLALIKAGVAPLVFLTIVHGIASAGDIKSAGRVGWRSILYRLEANIDIRQMAEEEVKVTGWDRSDYAPR